MIELFLATFGALFSVVNPLGAVPIFLAMTPHYTPKERSKTSLHTSFYFVLILLAFFWGGIYILDFFGISVGAMRIAGGLIILSSGYGLLSGKFAANRSVDKKVTNEAIEKEDISFSPMAMPLLSGPGSISLLIAIYTEQSELVNKLVISGALIATGVLVYLILRSSPLLFRFLGRAGLNALSRIMGFLTMAIGVQYIITGVVGLVKGQL